MVKGVSDVDLYYQYTAGYYPQDALTRLRQYLLNSYPRTVIKQDKPSIKIDFNSLPFNITPYKQDFSSRYILNQDLTAWQAINMSTLENNIPILRNKNSNYIALIKILKCWNFKKNKRLQNHRIEELVCSQFLFGITIGTSISNWMYDFFLNNGFTLDAQKMHALILQDNNNDQNLE